MQPSMANLNSPSSRVVKDSTPFRRRILRCKNFGKGESWPSLFLDEVNLYLMKFRHGESWTNARFILLLFCLFESESWPKINESAWWIFTLLYFRGGESWPNCFGKEVNWWWILTLRFCWKGEQRWRLEVGRFKMALTHALTQHLLYNTQYKCPPRDVQQKWVAKWPLWYIKMGPLKKEIPKFQRKVAHIH